MSDVEQRARDILVAEYERAGFGGAADDARSADPSPHCKVTLRAIIAALSAPKQVGVVPEAPSKCRECGSSSLSWFAANKNRTGVAEGRLRTDDVRCIFVLGCDECSETLFTISADAAANLLTTPQAAPVPVEGEGRKAIYQAYWTVEGVWEDLTREQFDALEDTEAVTRILYDVPPEQPAVGLEQFRPAVTRALMFANSKYQHDHFTSLLALIDGAKAGRAEGEE